MSAIGPDGFPGEHHPSNFRPPPCQVAGCISSVSYTHKRNDAGALIIECESTCAHHADHRQKRKRAPRRRKVK